MALSPIYGEGAVDISGTRHAKDHPTSVLSSIITASWANS